MLSLKENPTLNNFQHYVKELEEEKMGKR